MSQAQLVFHDPALCQCGTGECTCPCQQCQATRDRLAKLFRLVTLEDQLKASGIDPRDLADLLSSLMWRDIENQIELEAERLARQHLERLLSNTEFKEKLAELLFDEIVEIALGVQQGVKRNARVTT